jgi:hypothetical protein
MAKTSRSKRKATGVKRTPKNPTELRSKKIASSTSAPKTKPVTTKTAPARFPNCWQITGRAGVVLWRNKRIFFLITIAYIFLDLILVHSFTFNVQALKDSTSEALRHGPAALLGGLGVYSSLFSTAAAAPASSAFQFVLIVLMSLVVIWTLRQVLAREKTSPTLRAAFYSSTSQFVPFVLLFLLIGIELLPLLLGATLYSIVVTNGIVTNLFQHLVFIGIMLAFGALSLFWLTTSAVAMYVVTLPEMFPIKALRSAKELVRGRRLSVARKLLFLPVVLFVTAALIMVPTILIWAPLAQVVFFVLSLFGLIAVHAYLYTMYRGLLNE